MQSIRHGQHINLGQIRFVVASIKRTHFVSGKSHFAKSEIFLLLSFRSRSFLRNYFIASGRNICLRFADADNCAMYNNSMHMNVCIPKRDRSQWVCVCVLCVYLNEAQHSATVVGSSRSIPKPSVFAYLAVFKVQCAQLIL